MCGSKHRLRAAGPHYPAEAETVRLAEHPQADARSCGSSFPWWALWLLWPLFWVGKGTLHLALPAFAWLGQPIAFTITPLPLLLIGVGLLLLVVDLLRRTTD